MRTDSYSEASLLLSNFAFCSIMQSFSEIFFQGYTSSTDPNTLNIFTYIFVNRCKLTISCLLATFSFPNQLTSCLVAALENIQETFHHLFTFLENSYHFIIPDPVAEGNSSLPMELIIIACRWKWDLKLLTFSDLKRKCLSTHPEIEEAETVSDSHNEVEDGLLPLCCTEPRLLAHHPHKHDTYVQTCRETYLIIIRHPLGRHTGQCLSHHHMAEVH